MKNDYFNNISLEVSHKQKIASFVQQILRSVRQGNFFTLTRNTGDSRQLELSRDLKKSLTYREFEFSKRLMKTVKIDTGGFEKLFSSFNFFWNSQLQHSVLNYQPLTD